MGSSARAEPGAEPIARISRLPRDTSRARVRNVVLTIMAVHTAWIALFFALGHQPRDFIKIGTTFVTQSHASQVIRFDPHYRYPPNHDGPPGHGYDGQFAYYMALDLRDARYYMDAPGYRYTRVLYPLVVKGLAFNEPSAIPVVMIVVNWLALAFGSLAVAALLDRRGVSPWFALLYGLFPGLAIGLQRDLTEPLAYALVAAALLVLEIGGRRRWPYVAVLFALAVLARQTTAVFPVCVAAGMILGDQAGTRGWSWRAALPRVPPALGLLAIAGVPYLVYSMWLSAHIGPTVPPGSQFDIVPFRGLIESSPFQWTRQPVTFLTVTLPATIAAVVALYALAKRLWRWEILCLLLNALLFAILVGPASTTFAYTSTGRDSTGVVLSALLCLSLTRGRAFALSRRGRTVHWIWPAAALWMSMLPVVMVYGLANFKI